MNTDINGNPQSAIGVFDSGVGGLTALRKLADMLPGANLIYLGDTARVPYGNRSPEIIAYYAQQCTEFLLGREVKLIIVACNTVSAVALNLIESISPVPVIGVIKPAVSAALAVTKTNRIGIIGTRATIQSGAYELEFQKLAGDRENHIFSCPCPLFVPLVEEGWHDHGATYTIALEYLQPLITAQIDTLILGCTHYPLLKKTIQQIMPDVQLIDSGEEAAVVASQLIANSWYLKTNRQEQERYIECYVTDPTTTSILRLVHDIFGLPSETVQYASIDTLVQLNRLS